MKYARDEIERRWLAVRESLPDFSDLDCWTIEDLYLDGTRMRLRRMTRTSLTRRRYYSGYEGVGFGITTREGSDIVIVEAEYPSEDQARRSPVPPYCGREVSDDRQFEGFALSS